MPEKRPRAFILWRIEELLRRTLLHQAASLKVEHLVRQPESLGGRMGGEYQCAPRVLHITVYRCLDQVHTAHVRGGRRFIQQEDVVSAG